MKQRILMVMILVIGSWVTLFSTGYANDGDSGYPVPTEETKPPVNPTKVPTQKPPTQKPPTQEPTQKPTQVPTKPQPGIPNPDSREKLPGEFNLVCQGERIHPALVGLSTRYAVDYELLLSYFCNTEFGVGQIALALTTALRTNGEISMEELLSQRMVEGLGWGQIWQNLGLIGQRNQGSEGDPGKGSGRVFKLRGFYSLHQ